MSDKQSHNPKNRMDERLRLLQSIVANINDAILVTEAEPIDEPGPRIVFVNESFVRMTGYAPQEVIGKSPRILQGPKTDRARLDKVRTALSRQEPVRMELLNYRKDGTEYWVEISVVPIADESGKPTHFVSVQRETTGRKMAEQEQRRISRDLTTMFESITDAFFALDKEWRFTYLNSEAERVLDRKREDLINKNVWDEFPEAVNLSFYREYNWAVDEQRTVEFEEFYPPLDTWFEVKAYPSEAGLSVYFRDINERKRMEKELKESEERLRAILVQYASDIITIIEADGTIRYESPAIKGMLGYRPDELVGENVFDYLHPDDVKRAAGELAEFLKATNDWEASAPAEFRFRHADGSWRYLEATGSNLLDEPELQGIVINSRDVTERRQAEKALEESERRLVEAQQVARIGSWNWEVLTDTVVWSEELYRIYGVTPEQFDGTYEGFLDLVYPEDRDFLAGKIEKAYRDLSSFRFDHRRVHPNGEMRVLTARGEVETGGSGEPIRMFGTVQDVTERRKAEKALEESEALYRGVVDTAPDAIVVMNSEGVIESFNPGAECIFGYAAKEVVGRQPASLLLPERLRNSLEDGLRRHPKTGEARLVGRTVERVGLRKNGQEFPMELSLGRTNVQGNSLFTCVIRDISERERIESELKEGYDLLRAVMEGTTDAVFVKDLQGRYLMINQAGAEALGKGVEEVIGKDDTELFEGPDGREVMETDREIMATGETRTTEDTKTAEGRTRTFLATKGPYRDGCGNTAGMFGVARDITSRKESEEALRRSEGRLAEAQRMAHLGNWEQVIGGGLYWSDELYRIYGFTPQQFVLTYEDVMRIIHPDDREYIEKVQEEIIHRAGKELQVECRIVRPDGEVRVVQNSYDTDYDDEGELTRIAGTVQDITGRKWEERRQRAQHEVTRILAEAPTLEDAVPKILQAICESLKWDVGEFWDLDREAGVLHRTQTWNAPTVEASELAEAAHETTFSQGEGLLGRVWESGEPTWTPDVAEDENCLKMPIAQKDILRGGLGFPVLLGGTVLGVMSFFSREVRQPDKDLVDLMAAIGSQVGQFIERKSFEEQLQHRALHDDLTDLPNRTLFTDRLGHALERARRGKKSVAVLFLDLDNFKYVNDTLGHDTGDQLLVAAAGRLKESLRPEDTAARLGGDEFAVLLEEIQEPGEAGRVAERVLNALSSPFDLGDHRQFTSASVGIVVKHGSDHQPWELLRSADLAMYKAKTAGKNRYALFDLETERRSMRRLKLENDLRSALERDEFRVHYQPLVLLETGQVVGMEALVRWEHPQNGLVTPNQFIPVAEETGMIDHIGEKVLREACRQLRGWQERYPYSPPLIIGVNLSAKQLQDTDLVDKVEKTLRETGLEPEWLTLEVTENILVDEAEGHVDSLAKLRNLGVRFAIDDFGTGYSSLSYLKRLPAGQLKIDGSFVERVTEATEDEVLLRGVIEIAHGLNLSVTAEGVETVEQAALLEHLGCDLAQGQYFSKPLPAEEAEAILAKHAPST